MLQRKLFVKFTLITKTIICFADCYYKEYCLLYSLLLPRKILVMFSVITKKITGYVHCCYKDYLLCSLLFEKPNNNLLLYCYYPENYLLCSLLLQRKLLVMFTVIMKKITCYVYCYYKENYLLFLLLLQV